MKATLSYIEQKFNEFNALCFEGKLQPLPFRLSKARTFLGQVRYMRKRNLFGKWRYYNFVFTISSLIDLPENVVEDTIIHEMIHYYILSNQMQDTSAHGRIFRQMMTDINQRFGRNVTISHRTTKEERDSDRTIRHHLLCVLHFTTDRYGILIANQRRLFQLWDCMPLFPDTASCDWYITTDPFFNRYPRALTPKYYPISHDVLEEHLAGARKLVRDGNKVRIADMQHQ